MRPPAWKVRFLGESLLEFPQSSSSSNPAGKMTAEEDQTSADSNLQLEVCSQDRVEQEDKEKLLNGR